MVKTIAENLKLLQESKANIKQALIDVLGAEPGDDLSKYPDYILNPEQLSLEPFCNSYAAQTFGYLPKTKLYTQGSTTFDFSVGATRSALECFNESNTVEKYRMSDPIKTIYRSEYDVENMTMTIAEPIPDEYYEVYTDGIDASDDFVGDNVTANVLTIDEE